MDHFSRIHSRYLNKPSGVNIYNMAKKTRKKASKIKTKRKTWHAIIAPVIFGKKQIGELYLSSLDKALGRSLKVNLRDLTGSIRDQNAYIQFKISKEESSSLYTKPIGFQLTSAYVKRMVRKRKSKIDISHVIKSKEGKDFTIKYIILTRGKVSKGILTAIGKSARELVSSETGKKSSNGLFDEIINYSLQKGMKKKLSKIYPIGVFEVRFLKRK